MDYKSSSKITGWIVFAIAMIVYALTAEPTGSLWDCGEFITGAYKFEVVHPPGAPIFLIIGRMFTLVADVLSDNPENISYSINVMSGFFTALTAAFICWVAIIFGKIALVGREGETTGDQNIALMGVGLVAGLSTAFCSSIWFSAVEGEVYAMSTFFTSVVVWGMSKWYSLPDEMESDRWIVFSLFMAGLSIGVHLLSLLTLPAMALLYYFKKNKERSIKGMAAAGLAGVCLMIFIQYFVIVGIPTVWTWMERLMVNGLGMPIHSGLIPLSLLLGGIIFAGLKYSKELKLPELQYATVAFALILSAFSTIGVIVIRANVNTPINMNNPSNAMRLLPYLNREQYGERPLLYGPHFDARPIASSSEDRYDYVEKTGRYEITDDHPTLEYEKDKHILFPRISHTDREGLYMEWFGIKYKKGADGRPLIDKYGDRVLDRQPTMGDNLHFFFRYQIGWMYFRYFMWNFSGKQNSQQGYSHWDKGKGHWITGIPFIDNMRTHNMSELTTEMKEDQARNTYYMLPFIFGIVGLVFLFRRRPDEALALLALFFMTGIAIIIYSNQPPSEPRERDYVLVGSFFTFCIFIGLGVLGLRALFTKSFKLDPKLASILGVSIVMLAPLIMGFENYDDNSRAKHYGARDYASNFLNSVEENAIIFTYGDNDTYPLWYAQEVEGIRTDVRVVNLSLIQVDWYIDQLRRKVNDSEKLDFILTSESIRGKKRPQFFFNKQLGTTSLANVVKFMGDDNPLGRQGGAMMESFLPTQDVYIPVDKESVIRNKVLPVGSNAEIVNQMNFKIKKTRLLKGDAALLDILASNFNKRPIYFAVTVRKENLMGLDNYLQLEGLALRLVPTNTKPVDRYSQLGALGMGSVHADKLYDNVMNKWRWGNFDKFDMFVDDKYGPSVQSMHYSILRGAQQLVTEGKKEKAIALIDKYFEGFPNFNFAYDYSTVSLLDTYVAAGALDKAMPHIEILMNNFEEKLKFLESLDEDTFKQGSSFQSDYSATRSGVNQLLSVAARGKDRDLISKIQNRFAPFGVIRQQQPTPPPRTQPEPNTSGD